MTFVLNLILKMVATNQAKKLIIKLAENLAERSDTEIDDTVVELIADVMLES
jgi:hypothetical protein